MYDVWYNNKHGYNLLIPTKHQTASVLTCYATSSSTCPRISILMCNIVMNKIILYGVISFDPGFWLWVYQFFEYIWEGGGWLVIVKSSIRLGFWKGCNNMTYYPSFYRDAQFITELIFLLEFSWKYPSTFMHVFGDTKYDSSEYMLRNMSLAWYCTYTYGYVAT